MNTLAISDVHGMVFWKDALAAAGPFEHVVFLGDYFDRRGYGPYAKSQTENFLEICALVKTRPNVHLLLGNHDIQYTPWTELPTSSFDYLQGDQFSQALMDNIQLFKIVHIEPHNGKQVIFSHAGVTQEFLEHWRIDGVDEINARFKTNPEQFDFIFRPDSHTDASGDTIWQSPLWIRPKSLLQGAVPGFDQVVGHTFVENVEKRQSAHGDTIYFTCTFNSNCLTLD